MKFIILSCLIATTLGLPTAPSEPEPKERGIKEEIANAASNLAQNYNGIKNEVQNQLSNLPQQISDNVVTPIQQAVGPITETQDSYHITLVIPKPNWGSLSDYLPNFLKPGRYSSGIYGNRFQRGRNLDLNNYSGNAQEPGYIIVYALPNTPSWLQYPFSNFASYNNAQNIEARL